MLIVEHKNQDKTNIHTFLQNSMAKYTFFTIKTLTLDYLEEVLEIRRSNTTCFEFESWYKEYFYKISRGLRRLKENNLIIKFNSRAYKVIKEKIIVDNSVIKLADELRKNGLKVKIKTE